mgnify:CR=1 FL=1
MRSLWPESTGRYGTLWMQDMEERCAELQALTADVLVDCEQMATEKIKDAKDELTVEFDKKTV